MRQINFHTPVLLDESMHYLLTDLSGVYVDGTIGGGGHAEAILRRLNADGKLIGIDRDEAAITYCRNRFASYGGRVQLIQGELRDVDLLLSHAGINRVDGFFLDLGLSSFQLDNPERGFSHASDSRLDMRMDTSCKMSASEIINTYSEKELTSIFIRYGEERYARRIARRIIEKRNRQNISTAKALADVVKRATPGRQQVKTLSRIWQALRFEVNDELNQLREGLEKIYSFLKITGRIVVICYESLMDRMMKRFFRGELPTFSRKELPLSRPEFAFRVLTKRVIRPTEEEVRKNPRARSARLRACERLAFKNNII